MTNIGLVCGSALYSQNNFSFQMAYKRLAPENEVIKSLDDNENNSTASESMGSPSKFRQTTKSTELIETFFVKRFTDLPIWSKLFTTKTIDVTKIAYLNSIILSAASAMSTQLMHQSQTQSNLSIPASIMSSNLDSGDLTGDNNNSASGISDISNTLMSDQSTATCDLASFLINRACCNPTLANYLYWYLCIECESQETVRKQDEQVKNMYGKVLKTFKRKLMLGKGDFFTIRVVWGVVCAYGSFVVQEMPISNRSKAIWTNSRFSSMNWWNWFESWPKNLVIGRRKPKNFNSYCPIRKSFVSILLVSKRFRSHWIRKFTFKESFRKRLHCSRVHWRRQSEFLIFARPFFRFSPNSPNFRLTFLTTTNKEYVAIFKYGDDLRQDQVSVFRRSPQSNVSLSNFYS